MLNLVQIMHLESLQRYARYNDNNYNCKQEKQ